MRKTKYFAGFSLFEVLISVTIIAIVCGIALSMTVTGLTTSQDIINRSGLQERAMYIVNLIAKELMQSSWKTIGPTNSTTSNFITYQKITNYNLDTGAFTLGAAKKFFLKEEKDEKGNVISSSACWDSQNLSSDVALLAKTDSSKPGLYFQRIGHQSIFIHLTLEKKIPKKAQIIREYAETLVHVRQP